MRLPCSASSTQRQVHVVELDRRRCAALAVRVEVEVIGVVGEHPDVVDVHRSRRRHPVHRPHHVVAGEDQCGALCAGGNRPVDVGLAGVRLSRLGADYLRDVRWRIVLRGDPGEGDRRSAVGDGEIHSACRAVRRPRAERPAAEVVVLHNLCGLCNDGIRSRCEREDASLRKDKSASCSISARCRRPPPLRGRRQARRTVSSAVK